MAWWSSRMRVSPSGCVAAKSPYSRTSDATMSSCCGPPDPSARISSSESAAKSGSSSRPAATRWRRKTSQSLSSGSSRYHAIRRGVRAAQSASSVVFPNPASATISATRPAAARSSQSLSRGRDSVSDRRRGEWIFAPVMGNGYWLIRPARSPRPGRPGPTPMSACPSAPHSDAAAGFPGCGTPLGANDTDPSAAGLPKLRRCCSSGSGAGGGGGSSGPRSSAVGDVLGRGARGAGPVRDVVGEAMRAGCPVRLTADLSGTGLPIAERAAGATPRTRTRS